MFQKDLFKNKVYLITGGGTGLGLSMAKAFANHGASVAVCGRREDVLKKACQEIDKDGTKAYFHSCDVREYDQVQKMVKGVIDRFGRIDGLINNAAGNFVCPTEHLSPRGFDAVVRIVLYGTFNCTHIVGKHWIETGSKGNVLSICTTYSWTGSAFVVPSVCGKSAVLAMMRSLAVEWGKYKIRLNAIAPGPFPTEGAWKNLMPEGFEGRMIDKNPSKRLGKHEELTSLALYLMSDLAGYINGDCITIDGGEWLRGAGEFNDLLDLKVEDWLKLKMRLDEQRKKK